MNAIVLRTVFLCATLATAIPAVEAGEAEWLFSADVRVAGAFEQTMTAPSDRDVYVPYVSLVGGRDVGPVILYGRLRLGLPAYYGQLGAGVGAAVERVLHTRNGEAGPVDTVLFGAIESGGSGTFFDASPEIQYDSDAVFYWGAYGRAELGPKVLVRRSGSQVFGLVLSIGAEITWARYREPGSGAGRRLGLDIGIGGEYRF